MTPLFMNRLALPQSDALKFARFLVEDKDEEQEDQDEENAKIHYDPNRKANMQLVSVRLKLYAIYPKIFDNDQEQKARQEFTKAFSKRHIKFIRLVEQQAKNQDHGIINFDLFNALVLQIIGKEVLDQDLIECAYIYLCRPCPFCDVKRLLDHEMARCIKGFDSKRTHTLFTQIDDDETSSAKDNDKSTGRYHSVAESSHQQTDQARINLKKAGQQASDKMS